MKITLQVERHVVAVETDYRPNDTRALFDRLIIEVIRKMDFVLNKESEEKKPCKH